MTDVNARMQDGGMSRLELAGLACLVILGGLLRFYHLGQYSLWYDEVEQMAACQAPWSEFMRMITGRHLAPPLDFFFMRPLVAFSSSDASARVWSVLASTLCIPALYAWARPVAGKAGAMLAALLMATSAFSVAYAQEARMYSSFLLFTTLSFWALQRLQAVPTKLRALVYGLALGAVLMTHYFSYWVVILQAPLLVFGLRRQLGWARTLGLACLGWAVAVACFLPWVPIFLEDLKLTKGAMGFGLRFDKEGFSVLLEKFSSGRSNGRLFTAVWLFTLVMATRRSQRGLRDIAWLVLAGLALPLAVSTFKPIVVPRYLIFWLAPFYLVVGAGLADLAGRIKYGMALASVVLLAIFVPAVLREQAMGINAWKPRWHEAADFVNAAPGQAPVLVGDWTASIALAYYLKPFENHFVPELRQPAPPAAYRLNVMDEALVRQAEAGKWQGWVVVHFGVNRNPANDALVERLRKVAGPPKAHYPSPNESNGVDVLHVGPRS